MLPFDTEFSFDDADLASSLPAAKAPFYMIESGLKNAVRVAMLLKQPLLLTGKPGTGKTRLAYKLASDLNLKFPDQFLPRPLVFHTKTVSTYTDLLYTYDALGHFHAAHFGEQGQKPDVTKFIQLQALGQAILLSNPSYTSPYQSMPEARILPGTPKQEPRSSVVLIDEVDKAPRDFPNDLLNELDNFEFTVREDSNALYTKGSGQVLVILTSNSEKNLPDAFLRRCVFYHIDFPNEDFLTKLVVGQLFGDLQTTRKAAVTDTVRQYVSDFMAIRGNNLRKEPATAELVSWLFFLRQYILDGITVDSVDKEILNASFSILTKQEEDLRAVKALYQ